MPNRPELTTASALAQFRSELVEKGFTEEQAYQMCRDAFHGVIHEMSFDLVVRNEAEVA